MPVWINGQEWGTVQFPNREYQFKTVDFKRKNRIVVQWKDSNDITKLLMLLSYYKKSTAWWEKELELLMPYLPYSRADRYTSQQEIPTIELLGDLLKPYPISSIGVMSPHSDASDVCLDRLVHIPTFLMAKDEVSTRTVFENIVFKHNIDRICYPDKGAQKRYGSVIGYEKYSFHGDKVRGDGGKLSDFRLVDAPDLTDKSVLIIDDICSKGGTAYNIASLIRKAEAKNVVLYVDHCEGAIFAGKILTDNVISHVYTTNSIVHSGHPKITTLDVIAWCHEAEANENDN